MASASTSLKQTVCRLDTRLYSHLTQLQQIQQLISVRLQNEIDYDQPYHGW